MRQALIALAVLASTAALGQERGRTDGPEGSEIGKGGYSGPPGAGRFSLEFNWGASFKATAPLQPPPGPPLFVGLTGAFWGDDWILLEASTAYMLDSGRINVLIGPRMRTGFFPISASLGLQAGAIIGTHGLRFGISPNVSGEMLLSERFLLGLAYALDVPFGGDGLGHRIFMNVGFRF